MRLISKLWRIAFCSALTALTAKAQSQKALSTVQINEGLINRSSEGVKSHSAYGEYAYEVVNADGSLTERVELRLDTAIGGVKWSSAFVQMYVQFEFPSNPS